MGATYSADQSYYLDAKPAEVFRALVEPAQLVRWFLSKATVEPTAGGEFNFSWVGGYRMKSHLTRFENGRVVGFEWLDAGPGGRKVKTQVLFRVRKQGTGTLLVLRHTGFTSPRHFAECASRWAYYLTNLKSVLATGVDLRSKNDW